MNKIVLFTANTQGGIIQFTIQLYQVLKKKGFHVIVFMPDNVVNSDLSEMSHFLVQYKKEKKIFDNRSYKKISETISKEKPLFVWYMDNSTVSQKVGLYVDENIRQLLTMHDAGNYHPTNNMSVRNRLANIYNELLAKKFFKRVTKFLVLSKESFHTFSKNQPEYANKLLVMNLGAHLPIDEECMPPEGGKLLKNQFYLFFGRIDKYKGIGNLLSAYKDSNCEYPLVIAGNGKLTEDETFLCSECKNVLLINRYILDGEMKWLINNSMAVCLPYIEATQSGVIPLAYYYNKPVLVSDLAGLTQFVESGSTGYINSDADEWIKCFDIYKANDYEEMNNSIREYYEKTMDWDKNIDNVINGMTL